MKHTSYTDFDDNDFLQSWLESRYGCGFAQVVMDDLSQRETELIKCPFETAGQDVANDNREGQAGRKVS